MVLIDNYIFEVSEKPDKKLKVLVNGRWIHFGQAGYSHYYDKTNLLNPLLNHYDDKRRYNYLQRAGNIRDKYGNITAHNINSPNYWSINYLW